MRVLVTGAGGLLGPYLVEAFARNHDVTALESKQECDLNNPLDVKKLMRFDPEVVIHAAAMTDVDLCEQNPILAKRLNRDAISNILWSMPNKSKIVYISTDMVYPDIPGPHRENQPWPVNIYGKTKFAGERVVRTGNHPYLIFRTNFFGPSRTEGRRSFSDWVIQSLTNGSVPVFFNDVYWTPLHMETLCSTICGAVEAFLEGTYNLGSRTIMSKAAFAGAVAEQVGLLDRYNKMAVGPAHFKTRRPKDLSMDVSKIEQDGFLMPTLEQEIKKLQAPIF